MKLLNLSPRVPQTPKPVILSTAAALSTVAAQSMMMVGDKWWQQHAEARGMLLKSEESASRATPELDVQAVGDHLASTTDSSSAADSSCEAGEDEVPKEDLRWIAEEAVVVPGCLKFLHHRMYTTILKLRDGRRHKDEDVYCVSRSTWPSDGLRR